MLLIIVKKKIYDMRERLVLYPFFFSFVFCDVFFSSFFCHFIISGATFNNINKTDNLHLRFTAVMPIEFSKLLNSKKKQTEYSVKINTVFKYKKSQSFESKQSF